MRMCAKLICPQDRERKTSRMEDSGLSAEELQKQQEMLFAASRARYEASH